MKSSEGSFVIMLFSLLVISTLALSSSHATRAESLPTYCSEVGGGVLCTIDILPYSESHSYVPQIVEIPVRVAESDKN